MKIQFNVKYIYFIWAAFDFFYIVRFIWINIEEGRIPLISDALSFADLFSQHGVYSLVLFTLSLLLNVSIVFSAVLLLRRWKNVHWLIYAQTPLRLLFAVPSLSFLPWFFKTLSIKTGVIFICAAVLSEALKVISVHLARKAQAGSGLELVKGMEKINGK